MRIYGVDFTSGPSSRKPITVATADLVSSVLAISDQEELADWPAFEAFLLRSGPWIGGFDLPFSQSRTFICNSRLPKDWGAFIGTLPAEKLLWRKQLDDYKRDRCPGDKQHLRATDRVCRSCSPQMQYGVPVAMMFYEGVPRLRGAGVRCLPMEEPVDRSAIEAYPGIVVDLIGGKKPYKSDTKSKQTAEQRNNREEIVALIQSQNPFGITVVGANFPAMIDDPSGDRLDAVLCALQAAFALRSGFPANVDRLEGWIPVPRSTKTRLADQSWWATQSQSPIARP